MVLPVGSQLDLTKIPVIGLVPESSATASAPASPVNGQLWFDSTLGKLFVREAGAWVAVSNTGVELTANKGQASGYASLDSGTKVPIAQIPTGTSGTTVALGNDSRFTDSRAPSGSAGGDLTGSYPNPTIALLAVTGAKMAANTVTGSKIAPDIIPAGNTAFGATGTAVAASPALRALAISTSSSDAAIPGNARLNDIASANTTTADWGNGGFKIQNVAQPVTGTDAANKAYVDSIRQGFAGTKDPVRVQVGTNVTVSSPGATLDGVTMNPGDRVLLTAQTTTTQNGIYIWNAAAVPMFRATDADALGEVLDGTTVAVAEGTTAGSIWIQTAIPSGAPGAWTQTWTQFNTGGTTYIAGAGLVNNSNTFDVVGTTNRITVAADNIDISTNYVGQTSITTLGTITTGTWTGTSIAVANGGTGSTTAAGARTNLGAVGKYSATLGALVAGVETTITHNLNTTDIQSMFRDATTNTQILLAWRPLTVNTAGVTADVAYSASAVKVVVMG